jgi:acid phosphatase (class A)
MGSATVAQLHSDPVFRADLRAAALEVKSLRLGERLFNPNCAKEQEALKR